MQIISCVHLHGVMLLESRNLLTKQLFYLPFFHLTLYLYPFQHWPYESRYTININIEQMCVPIDRQNKYANCGIKLNNYPIKMWYAR